MVLECKGLRYGYGKSKWGADPNKKCIIIDLGKMLATENMEG